MTALPCTFVPGTMCDDRLWRPMLALMPSHQPVFCDYSDAETIEEMTETVLDQSPPMSHLIGFSLGGYLAIEAAVRAPHRFESLTVIAASPYGLTDAEKDLRHRNADMLKRLKYKGMSPARLRQFIHENHLNDPDIAGTIMAMDRDLGQDVLIRQLIAPIDRPNIAADLLALPLPIHFIMAEGDKMVPMGAIEKLATKSDRIILHRIEGTTGHMIPLEVPEELARILSTILF